MLLANFNGKEHLRHRAVSLRQHGFLVTPTMTLIKRRKRQKFAYRIFACKIPCHYYYVM